MWGKCSVIFVDTLLSEFGHKITICRGLLSKISRQYPRFYVTIDFILKNNIPKVLRFTWNIL